MKKFIENVKNNTDLPSYDEATVEHAIVTPLLNHLGWGVSHHDGIKFRYVTGKDKVDYALMVKGRPQVFIEVKRAELQFNREELKQILNYADYEGVELAVLTNGTSWWFYLSQETGRWEDRRCCTIDLLYDDIEFLVARFNDLLGKDKVENGEYIKKAKAIYEVQQREKIVLETLPKAWDRMIEEPHEALVKTMQDAVNELCTYEPTIEEVKCFIKKIRIEQKV